MSAGIQSERPADRSSSTALKAWVRALERTASIGTDPRATLPHLIEQLADDFESSPAVVSEHHTLSYRSLSSRANQYARWAIREGFAPGECVCLLLQNCPDYLAIWLGLTRAGVSVALLNTNLSGEPLAHSIRIVNPRALIVGAGSSDSARSIRAQLSGHITFWMHGGDAAPFPRIDHAIDALPLEPVDPNERLAPILSDRALYIYTSGTTGLPKAAIVTHLRLIRWAQWFSGMMNMTSVDRMYDCLPLYHSVGGIVATGATLVAGGAVVLRERFSAGRFWQDVAAHHCTVFQYIGELCRFLLAQPQHDSERLHQLRLACGNGMQGNVWTAFQHRFGIPHILEYYASTEGNVSLYNCEERVGSVGRIPPFLSHRYPVAVVRSDPDSRLPLRDTNGCCVKCDANEVGEVLGQILDGPEQAGTRFEGYSDADATSSKVLHNVFTSGDAWYRTGDLMTRDRQGFFYFIDRVGDSYRWRGENVSTTEVAAVLSHCTGVLDVAIYGVKVPGTEGRAGMAALVVNDQFDLGEFRNLVTRQLAPYARPVFLRIVSALSRTTTFKLQTGTLMTDGFDPRRIGDPLYFYDTERQQYVPLDKPLFDKLIAHTMRL